MTTRNLLESLELNDTIYDKGNLIVVHGKGRIESGFMGHFLLADFIRKFVTLSSSIPFSASGGEGPVTGAGDDCKGNHIVLVTTLHSQCHWSAIASKLGWNLKSLKDKGQLTLIDLLENSFNQSPTSLSYIYESIRDSISKYSHCIIIIEDLSSLLYQNEERTVIEFLLNLQSLPNHPTLISSVHSDDESMDHEGSRMANLVSTILADLTFQILPLMTGFSTQISGHLVVNWKSRSKEQQMYRRFQYKLDDRTVSFNRLG